MKLKVMGVTEALSRNNGIIRRYSCAVLWPGAVQVSENQQPPVEVQITDNTADGLFQGRKVGDVIEVS